MGIYSQKEVTVLRKKATTTSAVIMSINHLLLFSWHVIVIEFNSQKCKRKNMTLKTEMKAEDQT